MTWKRLLQILSIYCAYCAYVDLKPTIFGSPKTGSKNAKAPEKLVKFLPYVKSWCKAVSVKQEIDIAGCDKKIIKNKACVGKCSSYYIPSAKPSDGSIVSPWQCNCCKPSLSTWLVVKINCPHRKSGKRIDKLVQIIYGCKCSGCLN